jgi:hypothetical protein
MVSGLAEANGASERWIWQSELQGAADTAIDELLCTVDALRAERDAAVVRAEMAEAELAQLREDARAVLGRWHVAATTGDTARLLGLDDDEAEALTASAVRATHMGDSSLHRALRNVLALGELPPVDPAT